MIVELLEIFGNRLLKAGSKGDFINHAKTFFKAF